VFGFVIALSFIALLLLLPLTTSMRTLRISRELEELRERLAALESQLNALVERAARAQSAEGAAGVGDAEGGANVLESATPFAVSALSVPAAPSAPSAPFAPPSAPSAPTVPSAASAPSDLEGRIGGRGLLYVGVLVLLFGVSFFLKYAFENEWINETGRVLAGVVSGFGLIASGWRLTRRELRTFGQALIGTGLAIFYLSIYAALNFYALIGPGLAFALMAAVTVLSALLADRQHSQALACIAVGGGFLTPFLVGGREDAQLMLFSYDALLIAGTLILARRHQWLALNALSYLLTLLTVLAWAAAHYSDRTWLRTFLFLTLFCVMFVQILRETRRTKTAGARVVVALLTTAPIFYHIAAIILTARHPPAIHIYIIAFTAAGLWLTADPHRPGIRLLVLFASYAPLFGSITLPLGLSWTIANVVAIVAVAALHLLAILDRVFRQDEHLETPELVALHVVSIGLFGLLYQTLGASYPDIRGALAAVLAMGAIVLWRQLAWREPVASLNAFAVAFTLAALGVAVQFDGPAVVVGWAAEGAAATWVGLRVGSSAFQAAGLALWVLAVARLLDDYFVTPAGFSAILNARALTTAFVVTLAYLIAAAGGRHRFTLADPGRTGAALHVVASVITMLAITAEVQSYWAIRYETPQAYLYQQLILSLAWGLYGAVLIVVGMWRAYPPDRFIGIAVLAITVLKVFFRDLWELGGIYRVVGFIVSGVLLLGVSYLYQKRRGTSTPPSPAHTMTPGGEPRDENTPAG
jgi:uncharacterized membrane protein